MNRDEQIQLIQILEHFNDLREQPDMNDQGYQFKIIGNYQGKKEVIDWAKTKEDAEYLANEYRLAYGKDWYIYIIRY